MEYVSPTIGNLGEAKDPGFFAVGVTVFAVLAAFFYDGLALANYAAAADVAVYAAAILWTEVESDL